MVIRGNYHHHHHWSPLDRRYRYRKPGKSHTFIQMFSMDSFQHAFLPFIFKQCLTCRSAYGVLLVLDYEHLCISQLDLILTTIQVFQPFLFDFFCVNLSLFFFCFVLIFPRFGSDMSCDVVLLLLLTLCAVFCALMLQI